MSNNIKFDTLEDKKLVWHTTSHILANAIMRLFPTAKFGIGPAIDNGFYYDIDVDHRFTEEDLEALEKEMAKIVKEDVPMVRKEVSRAEALDYMSKRGEIYKVELINDLPEDAVITFYEQGDFTDLCAGPHLPSTGGIKAIKLLTVNGAYWRGSEKNKMLQRIYGISFPKKSLLDEYLKKMEEAKKRDHRKIGKEMDLFMIADEGPGFPFFLPKGMIIRNELEYYWKEQHVAHGYDEIKTPLILNKQLWLTSGHWDHYKDNMYFTKIDDEDYAIKPMNCPGSILVYKRKMYSYRDFPLRLAELGQVHRHELSGTLHGLFRVRTFTQDDSHIFMTPDQMEKEITDRIKFIDEIYKLFGFDYKIELSTRPEDRMGTDEEWDAAEAALQNAMDKLGKEYTVNPGDGAFYGPKLDFHLEDSIGRTWQCGTIQLDFQMPQRFDISYIGPDGEKHRPVMTHSVAYGSIERFIGILIENFEGKFPLWLAPVQVKLLTVTNKQDEYALALGKEMTEKGLRVEVDTRNEKIGYKIREARNARDSYIVVIGDKEIETGVFAPRSSKTGDMAPIAKDDFIAMLLKEIETKAL
ncbi:MAG: threonine--tRNA ligase [Firmicutes bacterium]|nr:threonine--tRNA ligase [Bacillota bacterium]MBQ5436152.1 threonine--tRNA ligase [Bacillota bacterium]